MNDTYLQILGRIASLEGLDTLSTVHTILKWILYAKERCSPVLITEVLSIKPGEDVRDSEEWTLSIILDICQNLVVYDEQLDTLRFAHFSVQEFLEHQPELNHETAHTSITEVCLTSLLYHFNKPTTLYWYATGNWAVHLGLSSCQNEMLNTLWKTFLTPSRAYIAWGLNVHDDILKGDAGGGGFSSMDRILLWAMRGPQITSGKWCRSKRKELLSADTTFDCCPDGVHQWCETPN